MRATTAAAPLRLGGIQRADQVQNGWRGSLADHRAGIPSTVLMRAYGIGKRSLLRLLDSHGVIKRRQGLALHRHLVVRGSDPS